MALDSTPRATLKGKLLLMACIPLAAAFWFAVAGMMNQNSSLAAAIAVSRDAELAGLAAGVSAALNEARLQALGGAGDPAAGALPDRVEAFRAPARKLAKELGSNGAPIAAALASLDALAATANAPAGAYADPIAKTNAAIESLHARLMGAKLEARNQSQTQAISGVVLMILALAVAAARGRRIAAPATGLLETLALAAQGDFTARAKIDVNDEFGLLAGAVNDLIARLETQGQELDVKSRALRAQNEALQEDLQRMLEVVAQAAEGDFTVEAEMTEGTIGVLADSFNLMLEDLSLLISRVRRSAEQVGATAQDLLSRSETMARGVERQAGQVSSATESVESMALSIQRVASNADGAAVASREATQAAIRGRQMVVDSLGAMSVIRGTVQDTAQKIKMLGESSLEVGEIVKIIKGIADRTNLLALNATIEAAKAGDAGRGFAVVADEVRKLADQVAKASNDIAALIQSAQTETASAVRAMEKATQEVESGNSLASVAGEALEQIVQSVSRSADLIEQITDAARRQAETSTEVVKSMNEISEVSRETAAGAMEASRANGGVITLTEDMRALVRTFKLKSAEGAQHFEHAGAA